MTEVVPVIGWILYILTWVYTLSGLVFLWQVRKTRGVTPQAILFQLAVASACIVLFGWGSWNKVHLAWIIPMTAFLATTFGMRKP